MAAEVVRVKKDSLSVSSSHLYLCILYRSPPLSSGTRSASGRAFTSSWNLAIANSKANVKRSWMWNSFTDCTRGPACILSRPCNNLLPPFLNFFFSSYFYIYIYIYTILTARLICPFFFFLISHLCHTFPILWQTFTRFYFTSPSLLPQFALFHSLYCCSPDTAPFQLYLQLYSPFILLTFFVSCYYLVFFLHSIGIV